MNKMFKNSTRNYKKEDDNLFLQMKRQLSIFNLTLQLYFLKKCKKIYNILPKP